MHHPFRKKKRFNPHTLWTACCVGFVIFVIAELLVFSWYFIHITAILDAPATPTHQTNAAAITSMNKTLDRVEVALQARSGISTEPSSQNEAPVVE